MIRSPERPYRAGLALVAGVAFLTHAAAADGLFDTVLNGLTGVAGVVLAWRVYATGVVLTPVAVRDIRVLRRPSWPTSEIADVTYGRPGGLWGGQCLMLTLRDGAVVPLLGSRVYAHFPIAAHPRWLAATAATLRDVIR
ncbi:hypothetical protein L083_6470 [Actinoplanes sp. N902-109]|nr:hypothetical protein L083_6470 [Actinoplanes sp. N902-109]